MATEVDLYLELYDEIERLRAEVEALKAERATFGREVELAAQGTIDMLTAEVEALRAWLRKDGRHALRCMVLDVHDERDHGCTCGLDAAREGK